MARPRPRVTPVQSMRDRPSPAPGERQPARNRFVAPASNGSQLRMLARVARMYHERGMRQSEIATELHISQPRVSRLLKQATEMGIVRTMVVLPTGVHTDLEDEVAAHYGLRDVVVVDSGGAADYVIPALGAAAAAYLETTLIGDEVVGISSWSASLLAAVEAMQRSGRRVAREIVQLVGGHGDPAVQMQATRMAGLLAELTGADPVFLPAPAFLGTAAARKVIVNDRTVAEAMSAFDRLTVSLVGIGSLEPSPLLRQSGNAVGEEEQAELRAVGAVGDVCLRFFDEDGTLVRSSLDTRVVGITPQQLRRTERRIAVAGGERKLAAIRAALRGRWINILITDLMVAERLLDEPE
jgi:DNA-binding transcriptional regulator LsrR (DeoR family)